MDIIAGLQSKKNTEAYQLLLLLEKQSEETDELYALFEDLIGLLGSGSSYVRVRGFRLACAQARWDTEGKIEKHLDRLLAALDDEKPAAVRQCLAALHTVARYRPNLAGKIRDKLDKMELSKYQDSMRPLIEKDIGDLRKNLPESIPKSTISGGYYGTFEPSPPPAADR